jgi:hypothetical protein
LAEQSVSEAQRRDLVLKDPVEGRAEVVEDAYRW